MNLEIKQSILLNQLNYAIKGISNKNIIPILNCIKLELTNEGLYMTSTDNEGAIKTFIEADSIEAINTLGSIVISGKYIYEIIRKLPNEIIKIEEVIDNKINIATANSSFNLNCNNVNEFPELNLESSKTPISLKQEELKNIIKETVFATSNQENRPEFTGVNLKIKDKILECTATDSYRLAKKTIKIKEEINDDVNIIIPAKNLIELERMLEDSDEIVEIHIFNNKIIFKFNNILVMSRLINGNYPDTNKLIATTFERTLSLNLTDFYQAIDRASLLTSEFDKNTIKLNYENNIVTISSTIPEIGYVEEKINVENDNKEQFKVSFSSKYMLDALKVFNCETVNFNFNGEEKPILITIPDSDDLIQLIVPIKTY